MALGFLCGLQGVSLAGVVALAPFYFILINYLYRFGILCCKIPPRKSEQGRHARKRRNFARRMLARSALNILLIQSFVIQPFATRQACGFGRIFFCCHACSFNFSPGRGACQPSPNLNENRTTQFCRLMQLTSFMTSLFYFVLLFSPCKIILMKGQGRLLH